MSAQLTSYKVEMEFAGIGAGWTNVTADVVLAEEPLQFQYGIMGNGPLDRVASVGTCTFALDNGTHNSGGLLGYYSPLNTNVRSGFAYGINVRVSFTFGGVTYYKFRGIIRQIEPAPGKYLSRITRILVADWMEQAAEKNIIGVALQLAKRSDQVFSAVLANIDRQPAATSIAVGKDTYTYALDNLGGGGVIAASLFQDIAQSELGLIYVKGDTTQGETLVYENRQTRVATSTNSEDLNETMADISVPRSLDNLFNRVEVTINTRTIDAAATTVLYSVPKPQSSSIAPGASISIFGDYRDPNQKAIWVGGTSMVNPVVTTDYTMNTAADGSGTDLSASFTVSATFFASTVFLVVTSNHATLSGFITLLQVRGKGLYRYDATMFRSNASASQTAYGLRPITIPMTYQDRSDIAQGAGDYLVNLYGNPTQQVDSVTFEANKSSALMSAALVREISDRIGLEETVTGVASTISLSTPATRGWYINSVAFSVIPARLGPRITCTWGLAPSDTNAYWIMDQVGASEMDASTRLGYI